MSSRFQAPRGTHDVLPADQPLWQRVTGTLAEVAELYGYRRIQTPNFEETGLFQRTSGSGSDIVQKEMYSFEDQGGRALTLRPEGTAPIARAYVEHGMHREPQPVKLYTVAPMYRYAAPQQGRYREHWQCSVEAIGSGDPALDAEVIQLYTEFARRVGITQYELLLNSIGDANCRPQYVERLTAWLDDHADVLDDDARAKRATNPLRVFDVKNPAVREALRDAPKIGESLCDECAEHFAAVRRHLDAYGVAYTVEPTLVRGLDYYTRTVFEFVGPEEKAQSAICSGGRYDGLVAEIGGPATPGIGFGAGIERALLALGNEGITVEQQPLDVFFAVEPGQTAATALADVRRAGFSADTDYAGRSMKGQLTQGARAARRVVVVAADGWTLRSPGERDRAIDLDGLLAELRP
ncbi:MAG: histidine--tRNA ligase [Actinobacteria bacterium]|nr:histidine--tRNA ligase [Actinomycetota bacterium]MBV8599087.1 histidine--tRNA ligase [Actinomycetota bacterium]